MRASMNPQSLSQNDLLHCLHVSIASLRNFLAQLEHSLGTTQSMQQSSWQQESQFTPGNQHRSYRNKYRIAYLLRHAHRFHNTSWHIRRILEESRIRRTPSCCNSSTSWSTRQQTLRFCPWHMPQTLTSRHTHSTKIGLVSLAVHDKMILPVMDTLLT
jgi:hypothetical protein